MASADAIVLSTVNASLPTHIDGATLAACLVGSGPAGPWYAHLAVFFTESSVNAIEAFASAHGVTTTALAAAYARSKQHTGEASADVEDWLGYLGVADAPA